VTVIRSVKYGERTISFELERRKRKTLEIAVRPDGSVRVRAPLRASENKVLDQVVRRGRWILGKQRFFEQFHPQTSQRQWVGGETHLYLGRQYRLAIALGDRDGVKLVRGWFRVCVARDLSPDHVRRLMESWYTSKARLLLAERLDDCWARFPSEDVRKPNLRLRQMKTRWGSLSPSGTMSIRRDLVRAPRECIDYVVFHELCHLVHRNHGREYYQLLERMVPDWKARKHRLELALA
jgi:predicted metal-dependent hydrolase